MLYHLLYPLRDYFFGFNVFRYITFRSAYATVTALLICFIFGPRMIRWLSSLQIGKVREDVPERHNEKTGTPSMGGMLMICAIVIPTLIWADLNNPYVQLTLVVTIWTGAIGFIDDYLSVIKKRDKGLVGRYKLIGQLVFGLALGIYLYLNPMSADGTRTVVPFFKDLYIEWGIFYIPLVMVIITGTSNAVNLTDGLDGLATGISAFCFLAFALIAYLTGNAVFADYLQIFYLPGAGELAIYCMSVVGAALGFLWFNTHPARIFMGDTGSLALGGALGAIAILLQKELLLVIVGGVFVVEALSAIIQVVSYRYRGGR
ncbi:MAG: phospho-N-acetylmuramoyl-pentapeptide-transferase, partial [Candidatus Krumholzibacteria bacterium]|nr:phospho-N-acetylmuramoyl-pentapeptide-transferase [Candidatus Krumholzibacteria bacterium]